LNPVEPEATKRHNVDILLAEGLAKEKIFFPFSRNDNCIVVDFHVSRIK
jgi:hypothetical protein